MEHKHECDKFKKFTFSDACPVEVVDNISVKVPVIIHTRAHVDDVEFECKGHHIEKNHCAPDEHQRNTDKFTIVQKIQVRIPVKFDVECDVCESRVKYEMDEDCNDNDDQQ